MWVIPCLTLTQPWATLMACGAKRTETRSWSTSYQGVLGIHAGKNWKRADIERCFEPPFSTALKAAGIQTPADLPRGDVIAILHLHDVARIKVREWDGAVIVERMEMPVKDDELPFGLYTPGRFGWRTTNGRALAEPVPATGRLGLWPWEVPPGSEAEALVRSLGGPGDTKRLWAKGA